MVLNYYDDVVSYILGGVRIRNFIWGLFLVSSMSSIIINDRLFGVNLSISDLLFAIMFFLITAEKAVLRRKDLLSVLKKNNLSMFISMSFVCIGALLALSRAAQPFESFTVILQYVFIFVVLFTIIDYLYDGNLENAKKILGIWLIQFIVSTVLVSLSGLGLFNAFDDFITSGSGRYQGLFGRSTSMGMNTVLSFVFVLFFWRTSKYKKTFFILLLATLYAVLLSASFGSIALLLGAIFAVLLLTTRKLVSGLFLVFSVVVLLGINTLMNGGFNVLIAKYAPEKLVDRIQQAQNSSSLGSSDLRMDLNRQGVNSFVNDPLVGVGLDQYRLFNPESLNIHNTIIAAAAEAGLFGLIGVMMFLIIPLKRGFAMIKLHSTVYESYLYRFLLVYAVVRVGQTFISGPFVQRWPWIPIILLFVIYVYVKGEKNENKDVLPNSINASYTIANISK